MDGDGDVMSEDCHVEVVPQLYETMVEMESIVSISIRRDWRYTLPSSRCWRLEMLEGEHGQRKVV